MTLHFVANENALVYWKRGMSTGFFGVLAGGPSKLTAQVHLGPWDDLRFATVEDFERFNVSPKYHLPEPERTHDEITGLPIW